MTMNFFENYLLNLENRPRFDESDIKRMKKLLRGTSTDRERFEVLWKDYKERKYCRDPLPKDKKNLEKAMAAKEQGNQLYALKMYREAIICYNKGLCKSPTGSPLIGVLYANRSAVYLAKKLPIQSLENINLALENGYPVDKRDKLEERRAKCLSLIDQLPEEKVHHQHKPFIIPALSPSANKKFPFVSESIGTKIDPQFGPQLYAKKDLKVGDIIFKEPPFLRVIDSRKKEDRFTFCTWCLKPSFLSLLPCPGCSVAMWCSECFLKFHELHEKLECSIWKFGEMMDHYTPLFFRCLARILLFYDYDFDRLQQDMLTYQENPKKLLKGDFVNNPEREIVKWIFPCFRKPSKDDFPLRVFRCCYTLNILLLDQQWKMVISLPKKEMIVLELLFCLTCQPFFEAGEWSIEPIRGQFFTEEILESKAVMNYSHNRFVYVFRPIKKGETIKITNSFGYSKIGILDDNSILQMQNGNMDPAIAFILSNMPHPLLKEPAGINIPQFVTPIEVFRALQLDPDYQPKDILKNMARFIHILTDYDKNFPCSELALVMWCFQWSVPALYTDLKFYDASNMFPEDEK